MFGLLILSVPLLVPILHKLLDTHYNYSLPDETNNKEHAKEEEEVDDINNLWSELDPNLLGEILGRLCLTDQIRFHVVCKNWLHAHPITKKIPLLWYLSFNRFDRRLFRLQLHDPSSSDPVSLTKLDIPSPPRYRKASTTLLSNNWLFICTRKQRLFFWECKYILLLSPFTKKVITLPAFDHPCPYKKFTVTSSTQPDSPDCVFFFVDTKVSDKVTILTYRNGDEEWVTKEFNTAPDFLLVSCKVVYLHGILYIVSPYGQLASYNIADGEFKFENLFVDQVFRQNFPFSRICRAFELDGELMMVHLVPHKKKDVTSPGKQFIKRYNWSSKDWIPVSTLTDNSLFFREDNNQVVRISKDDMRNNGVLSNKIYQFSDGGCLIYSIENGELVKFKSVDSNSLEDGGNDLPEYKYKVRSRRKAMYWLEPPRVCSRFS